LKSSGEAIFSWIKDCAMLKGYYDMGRDDTLEGVFYLFAINLIGGPGFTHTVQPTQKQSSVVVG